MKGKIVFITGSTSGIGEACAHKFATEGAKLILNGRNEDKLKDQQEYFQSHYRTEVFLLPFDVRNREEVQEAVSSLPSDWRAIDLLINNAGLALGLEKEFEGDIEEWETMIDTNIKGLLYMTRIIVPGMVERGVGHIINIGSIAGEAAYPGAAIYCATKAAVRLLTDGLRIDLVDTPLRVTNIKPGWVETNFSVVRFRGDKSRADKVYEGMQPLAAEDIAESVYFAASAPAHVQIAEILIMPTNQATGTIVAKKL